jgi:AraC-like DNA-binding protein
MQALAVKATKDIASMISLPSTNVMETNRFDFFEIDTDGSFSRLAASFGRMPFHNYIELMPGMGNGRICKIDLEEGLHLRAWEISMNTGMVLHRQSSEVKDQEIAIHLFFFLSPGAITVEWKKTTDPIRSYDPCSLLVIPGGPEILIHLASEQEIKMLDISMNAGWLKKQFTQTDINSVTFLARLEQEKEGFLITSIKESEYRTIMDLYTQAFSGLKGLLYIKARTLSLISDIFSHSIIDRSTDIPHREKMLMVERLLEDHFEKTLPSIESIARQASLSESTLKRHFKQMFGKSIYECYLEKKMAYAKRLLLENHFTVKEVAYRLGYEKPSNFIHIFKKFHHYSPGHLRKNILV